MRNVSSAYFPYSEKEAEKHGVKERFAFNKRTEFPTRLRKLREDKKETLEVAAREIGVTRSTLGLYEKGENVPDVKVIVRIASHYGATVNYLLGEDERPTYSATYIAKETGLSDAAISVLIANKLLETDRTPPKHVSFCEFLSSFIKSNQLMQIIQLIRDYAEHANISFLNDSYLNEALKELEKTTKRIEASISSQDELSEIHLDDCRSMEAIIQRMRSVLGSKSFELTLLAAKYQAVSFYGAFFEDYLKQTLGYLDLQNND